MKKLIYSLASCLMFCCNQNAAVAGQQPSSAWRIGVGLAGEYMSSNAKLSIDYTPFGANLLSNYSQESKQFQVAPSIELGTTFAKDYYLGMLLSWHYSAAKANSRLPIKLVSCFINEFKINNYTDILLKTGYKITPSAMVYGLIGPSIANWSHISYQYNGQALKDTFKMRKTTVGLGLGLGFEYIWGGKYAVSVDYTHHIHSATSQKQNMSFLDNVWGVRPLRTGDVIKKVKPSYSAIAVRFTVFF